MTERPKPLEGRIALVTGASRGIGAATARALAEAGAHVVLTARAARDLEAVEDSIHTAGGTATIAPMDLTESDSIARLAAAVAERWHRLDILSTNAPMLPPPTPATQIERTSCNQARTLNVLAPQALPAPCEPQRRRSEAGGRVIGLTSSVGAEPRAYWSAYGASKAAFDNLLACYAQEVEKVSETRVTVLDPGATRTEMRARAYPGEDPRTVKAPEVVAAEILTLVERDPTSVRRDRVNG